MKLLIHLLMSKKHLRKSPFLVLFLCCAKIVRAEVRSGEHVVILGAGAAIPTTDYNAAQNSDLDSDGINDGQQANVRFGARSHSEFLGYTYYPWTHVGFGLEVSSVKFVAVNRSYVPLWLLSGDADVPNLTRRGEFTNKASLLQTLVMAKYVFLPTKNYNPYLMLGMGIAYLRTESSAIVQWRPIGGFTETQRVVNSSRNSLGPAFSLGGGCQTVLGKRIVLGVEGRWNYCRIAPAKFGANSANFASGYLWAGWKWTAPF